MAQSNTIYDPNSDERKIPHPSPAEEEELRQFRRTMGMPPEEETRLDKNVEDAEVEDSKAKDNGFFNQEGDREESRSKSSDAERSTATEDLHNTESGEGGGSLYSPEKDKGSGRGKSTKLKLKALAKNKLVLGGVGGGAGVAIIIVLLLLFLSSLKLPDVMENIETYEFARVTQEFADTANDVTAERMAVEAAGEGEVADGATAEDPGGLFGAIKSRYQTLEDNTWGRFNNYRPEKVLQTMGDENDLVLTYRTSPITGRRIWTGGRLNTETYKVDPVEGLGKYIPGVRQFLQRRNQAAVRDDLIPDIIEQAQENGMASIIKGSVERTLVRATDGSLAGYLLDKFQDLKSSSDDSAADQAAADATEDVDSFDATQAGATAADGATTSQIRNADAAADEAAQQEANDPSALAADIEKAGGSDAVVEQTVDSSVSTAMDSQLGSGFLTDTLSVLNPIYTVAVPVCIVYDSSVVNSGPTIGNQMNQEEDLFDQKASEADEQKAGTPLGDPTDGSDLALAISASGDQLGDTTQSIPEMRASGATVNTSMVPSAEAGAGGGYNYSIITALAGTGVASSAINYLTGHVCPAFTNTYVGLALGAAALASALASFGTTEVGIDAAGKTTTEVVEFSMTNLKDNIIKQITGKTAKTVAEDGITKEIRSTALNRGLRFAFKQGLIIAGTVGGAELAHLIVASNSGATDNGFAQGTDLVNEVDSGANIEANELDRMQLFGRPLLDSEVGQSSQQSTAFIADQTKSETVYERYADLDNSASLLSRVAITLDGDIKFSSLSDILGIGTKLLDPLKAVASLFTSIDGRALAAAAPSVNNNENLDYGNVQFGWSQAEENLANSGSSYMPLENQAVLDASGNEGAIASQYAVCFGYTYTANSSGVLDPTAANSELQPAIANDGPGSLATLLSSDDIMRDANGNVINGGTDTQGHGLCSPENLSPSNSDYGPQMVFRWRLAMRYDTTLDQLNNEQSVTAD